LNGNGGWDSSRNQQDDPDATILQPEPELPAPTPSEFVVIVVQVTDD
jgi:hypothetical protein